MTRDDGRIRLTLVGGFLGSGKSTWVRHQLHEGRFSGALVIVNEAAEAPVDNVLLAGAARMELLAGGCACCTGREAMVALLRDVCDRRTRPGGDAEPVEEILLETSGLADPGPIVEAIGSDPVLVHHVVLRETVVAVDGVDGLRQVAGEPLWRRQAQAADRFVVTKVDRADPEELRRLVATLASVSPGVPVEGVVMGSPAPLPDAGGAEPMPLADGGLDDRAILATRLTIDERTDWVTFAVWLSALLHARGDDVLRVKGVIRTPAGRLLLQSVRRVVQNPEILPEGFEAGATEDDTVAFIGRGFTEEDLRRSLDLFAEPR